MTTQESDDARIDYERENVNPSDLELDPVSSEDEDYSSAPADYQITTYPADFTLEGLHQKWQAGEIIIPDFQRAFVWKPAQSSKLIESFLVGLPVPPVFVYTERQSQNYLVIDGQQRLKSVFYFLEGYFGGDHGGNRRVFRLSGLNQDSRFLGKTFNDLLEPDQRKVKNAVLRSFVVQQLEPDDDTSVYHIFERLNTGGTLLSNQEIRNSVHSGRFVEYLAKLNGDLEWRKILGKPVPDSRKRDIELLVRFFAMRDISSYQKPMKDFLSKFMKKNQNASADSVEGSQEVFRNTCAQLVESLGEKPFHGRSGVNVAVLDAVMVAFSQNLDCIPVDIKARYETLRSDGGFVTRTRQGTTDVTTVRERIEQAKTVLFG